MGLLEELLQMMRCILWDVQWHRMAWSGAGRVGQEGMSVGIDNWA
jgi:hypothetical protein